jgi:hypothetical protein
VLLLKENPKLSIANLINIARNFFTNIQKENKRRVRKFDLSSFLMSGLAIFYLKESSLLAFDSHRGGSVTEKNLQTLFHIDSVPSDTHFREVVDDINTSVLMELFGKYVKLLKDNNILKEYSVFNKHVLVSIDGTGFFQSDAINCTNCIQRKMRDGKISYEHQALPAVMIHPDNKEVFPIALEIIERQDGQTKNDCERNASKRLIEKLRNNYPDLEMIIVEDSLASNVPHIKELQKHKMKFILGIKPGDHKNFFEKINILKSKLPFYTMVKEERTSTTITTQKLSFRNVIDLSSKKEEIYVNYIELEEVVVHQKTGDTKKTNYSWVTDIPIDKNNAFQLMRMARSRWKIENETFNTLKNQGYNFEHNFGHGKKNLANNMCVFMFIAFLIDQIQKYDCSIYQNVLKVFPSKKMIFETIRGLFRAIVVKSFYELYEKIIFTRYINQDKYAFEYANTS